MPFTSTFGPHSKAHNIWHNYQTEWKPMNKVLKSKTSIIVISPHLLSSARYDGRYLFLLVCMCYLPNDTILLGDSIAWIHSSRSVVDTCHLGPRCLYILLYILQVRFLSNHHKHSHRWMWIMTYAMHIQFRLQGLCKRLWLVVDLKMFRCKYLIIGRGCPKIT